MATEAGEEVKSEEATGAFHRRVATWPLELVPGVAGASSVRLYDLPTGMLAVLAATVKGVMQEPVRWMTYSSVGELLQEKVLFTQASFDARAVSMAVDGTGTIVATSQEHGLTVGLPALRRFSAGLEPLLTELLTLEGAPEGLPVPVLGEVSVGCGSHVVTYPGLAPCDAEWFYIDNLLIRSGGRVLLFEDFDSWRSRDWRVNSGRVFVTGSVFGVFGAPPGAQARLTGLAWDDFELDLDILLYSDGSIGVGGDSLSAFGLDLDSEADRVRLDGRYRPPPGSPLDSTAWSVEEEYPLQGGFTYHLRLEYLDGRVTARVSTPVVWHRRIADPPVWMSVAAIGDVLALTADAQTFSLSPSGDSLATRERRALDGWVGEIRVWESAGRRRVGVCLPGEGQVRWGTVISPSAWDAALTTVVGPVLPGAAGALGYPLSFDAGPDGRVYVLDAGSARVVVFDAQGRYITQWGRRGTGDGEFDFGDGTKVTKGLSFTGSLTVDEDGYIYVADTRRIQKFAP